MVGYAGYSQTLGVSDRPAGRLTVTQAQLGVHGHGNEALTIAAGDETQGELIITNGRVNVSDGGLALAYGDDAVGSLELTGGSSYSVNLNVNGLFSTGGFWIDNPQFDFGAGSESSITIQGNAYVNCADIELSQHPESHTDLTMSSGTLSAGNIIRIGYRGSATVSHTGGSIDAQDVHLGAHYATATAEYTLNGATAALGGAATFMVGEEGTATFNHMAGTVETDKFSVGAYDGSDGAYNQTGGLVTAQDLYLAGSQQVQSTSTAYGAYNLSGGTLQANFIWVGATGTGIFNIGNSNAAGTLAPHGSAGNLMIGRDAGATGALTGWSYDPTGGNRITLAGTLTNNGQVFAVSYDVDARELQLDTFTTTTTTLTSVYDEGWYAVDHGKLVLRPAVDNNVVTWGAWQGSASNGLYNLVNSLYAAFDDDPEDPGIALLATDRTAETPVTALFDAGYSAGCNLYDTLGIWEFTSVPEASADLAFRFLPLKVGQIDEKSVALARYGAPAAGRWNIIERARPSGAASHTVSAAGVSFSGADEYFAVVEAYPGDATLDGAVNIFDLQLLSAAWNTQRGQDAAFNPAVDFNADDEVNVFDLQVMSGNWNTDIHCEGDSQNVSESREDDAMDWYSALDAAGLLEEWLAFEESQ